MEDDEQNIFFTEVSVSMEDVTIFVLQRIQFTWKVTNKDMSTSSTTAERSTPVEVKSMIVVKSPAIIIVISLFHRGSSLHGRR